MSTAIQRRGGTTAQHASFTGLAREVTIDTDKNTVVVHDGSTAGGFEMLKNNLSNINIDGTETAGYALKADGDGTYSWGVAGGLLQVKTGTYTGSAVVGGTYTGGHLTVSVTPKAADSSFLIIANCFFGYENHDLFAEVGVDVSGAAPGGTITPLGATDQGDNCYHLSGIASTASDPSIDDWAIATTPMHYFWTPSSNLGTGTRTFQIVSRRRGSAGNIRWNSRWSTSSDARNARPVSTMTVVEISSGVI